MFGLILEHHGEECTERQKNNFEGSKSELLARISVRSERKYTQSFSTYTQKNCLRLPELLSDANAQTNWACALNGAH